MKIGIQHRSGSFSDRWIRYCEENSISFKIVDCYKSNIIEQLKDCDALMWHYIHGDFKNGLFAKQLLFSIEQAGKIVFPNFNTSWHFDDKVGQKYLLENVEVPLIPSYVFYDKASAIKWVEQTKFPKVFKLRGGAGAANVSLVENKKEALHKVDIAFGKGFSQFNKIGHFKEYLQKFREKKVGTKKLLKATGRLFFTTEYSRMQGTEKGYIYFQDFIPNNDFDIRVIVIGDHAFAIKRMTRKNDFRASGSGTIFYEKKHFSDSLIALAFQINGKLNMQSCAMDFVYLDEKPLLVEVSYGFAMHGYVGCEGYWDRNLNFHKGKFNSYGWMVNDVLDRISSNQSKIAHM